MKTPDIPRKSLGERLARPVAAALLGSVALTGCNGQREPEGPSKVIYAEQGQTLRDIVDKECGTIALFPPDWLYPSAERRILELEGNEFNPKQKFNKRTPIIIESSMCADIGYATENR